MRRVIANKEFYALTFCTFVSIRIASISSAAIAKALVISSGAVGIDGTLRARVHTSLVSAGQSNVAVWVHKALIRAALHSWVSLVLRWAHTVGSVTPGFTDGIDPTLFKEAWVLALSFNAGLIISTFEVALTAG
jgi:hypothetical protein